MFHRIRRSLAVSLVLLMLSASLPGIGSANTAPPPATPGNTSRAGVSGMPDSLAFRVVVSTGHHRLQLRDLVFPGNGILFQLVRRYDSQVLEDGPFGYGWRINLGGWLKIYDGYHINEFRGNGATALYTFVKDDPRGHVYEYDGDYLINYDLSKGHYEPAADGSVLERISATEYRITRKDGTVYTYLGYHAAWRVGQPASEGELIRVADREGNTQSLTYDDDGRLISLTDTAAGLIQFGWSGGRIATVAVPDLNWVIHYLYDGAGNLVAVRYPDQTTVYHSYDAARRMTMSIDEAGRWTGFAYAMAKRIGYAISLDMLPMGQSAEFTSGGY